MTPLLFLHGALGSKAQFDPLLRLLPPDWPVFALNFPGHGGVPADEPFSMRLFTEAVLQCMDDNAIAQATIFGYSMGGYVALQLAAEHPKRVQQVITLGTKLDWSPEVAAGMSRMFDPVKIEAKVPHFGQMLADLHAPLDWKKVCTDTTAFLHDLGNGRGLADDAWSKITCPVTIGWGSEDTVVSREESELGAERIAQGKFVVLEGVRHPIEQVEVERMWGYIEGRLVSDSRKSAE